MQPVSQPGEEVRSADKRIPLLMALILIIGVFTRLPTLVNIPMWWDEVWTMWQTQGSLIQAIRLTPYNWPPGYYALMQIWTTLVGHNDTIGRYFSLLCGLLSIALMYRVGRTLVSNRRTAMWVGCFAALLTAVLPYTTYLTIEARGYALFAVAIPLTLWLHIRFQRQPSIRRAIGYGLALVLCLYTSYTGLLLIGFSLAHSLWWIIMDGRRDPVSRRRLLIRWLTVVAVLVVSAIPIVLNLISIVQIRRQNIADHLAVAGSDYFLSNLVSWLAGGQWVAFALVSIVALIGLIGWLRATRWHDDPLTRDWQRLLSYLAVWAVLAPVVMFVFRYYLLLVALRYAFYFVPGIILVIALGLSRWPRVIRLLISLPILLYAMSPIPLGNYRPGLDAANGKPLRDLVRELSQRYQAGDVVWVDPKCACGEPFEWSYYESVYFPGSVIPTVTDLSQAGRRIWYVSDQKSVVQSNVQKLSTARSHTVFFGPSYLIADLYEAPPNPTGVPIGPTLRFYGADLPRIQPVHPGDTITIRLWWSIANPVTEDAIATVTLVDQAGQNVVVQSTLPIQAVPAPVQPSITMSHWQPGNIYVDERIFTLPIRLAGGDYPVKLTVAAANNGLVGSVPLGTVKVFNTPDQEILAP